MFMNPKDAPFAVAMALLLLGLVRAFQEYPGPSPATIALFGIGLGLTIGSRIIGGMAAVYAAVAVALIIGHEARALGPRAAAERLGCCVLALLPGLVLAYVVMALVWPWAVVDPLNPFRSLTYFSVFFEKPWHELFGGALVPVPDMPRSYVPTLFALQMPEVFLVLTVCGIVTGAIAIARKAEPVVRRAALLLVIVAALLPVAIAVATRPAMYNGIRHFIIVVPPLAALGGLAGAQGFAWLARRGRGATALGAILLAGGLMLPIAEFVRLHPYEYTHFNHLAGGIAGAGQRYMRDYWGLSLKQAAAALRRALHERGEAPPAGRPWRIAVCGPHPPAAVALGPAFEPTWDPKGADLALTLGEFYCARLDAPLLAEITRAGVVYARAYDLRGRNVDTLFTLPPVER
jgi:hypothetical protein